MGGWVWGQAGAEGSVQPCLAHKGSLLWVMGLFWQLYLLSVAFIKVSSFRPSNLQPLCVLPQGPAPLAWLADSEGPPHLSPVPQAPQPPASHLHLPARGQRATHSRGNVLALALSTQTDPDLPHVVTAARGWGRESACTEFRAEWHTRVCIYVHPGMSLKGVHPSVPSAPLCT